MTVSGCTDRQHSEQKVGIISVTVIWRFKLKIWFEVYSILIFEFEVQTETSTPTPIRFKHPLQLAECGYILHENRNWMGGKWAHLNECCFIGRWCLESKWLWWQCWRWDAETVFLVVRISLSEIDETNWREYMHNWWYRSQHCSAKTPTMRVG